MEENVSSFTDDTDTHCDFSITDHTLDTENANVTHTCPVPKYPTIHSQRKHVYRNTFGDAHIQYYDCHTSIHCYHNKTQLYPTPSLSTEHAHRGCTTWLTE